MEMWGVEFQSGDIETVQILAEIHAYLQKQVDPLPVYLVKPEE